MNFQIFLNFPSLPTGVPRDHNVARAARPDSLQYKGGLRSLKHEEHKFEPRAYFGMVTPSWGMADQRGTLKKKVNGLYKGQHKKKEYLRRRRTSLMSQKNIH